jgi:hypothetical protein
MVFILGLLTAASGQAQLAILHSFTGFPGDGDLPQGPLIQSGSTLYGTTYRGGIGAGAVFRIETDGTGFGLVHSFTGALDNGGLGPTGVIQDGSSLYGMTAETPIPGTISGGTVYRVDTDGTGYARLYLFTGGLFGLNPTDGVNPVGSLVRDGSSLFGVTRGGGTAFGGTAFRINTDGTGFNILHSFGLSPGDGVGPSGTMVQSGSTLYGLTGHGGGSLGGTIYRMNTDGSGFGLVHSFSGNGIRPRGPLVVSGSTLFGMTTDGPRAASARSSESAPTAAILRSCTLSAARTYQRLYSVQIQVPEPSSLTVLVATSLIVLLHRRRNGAFPAH